MEQLCTQPDDAIRMQPACLFDDPGFYQYPEDN